MDIPADQLRFEPLEYNRRGQVVEPNLRQSGVRLTHLPTETVVEVMLERSQMANKRLAMRGLAAILGESNER